MISQNMQTANDRKDLLKNSQRGMSRRPSQLSNYSSFIGMGQAVVGDRQTSNGNHDVEMDAGKSQANANNASEMNEQTLQSVQQISQMLHQNVKGRGKALNCSPPKLDSRRPSLNQNDPFHNIHNIHNSNKKSQVEQDKNDQAADSNLNQIQSKKQGDVDFSEIIKCIETKKNFLYFHFINNIGKHFVNKENVDQQKDDDMLSEKAIDFLQSYNDMYVQIQEKQLKLFIKALMFYSENDQQSKK